ncbi:hypothetical protein K443DRAFT_675374 [Laccaria amethystina LaAM-08-1]|uniref:Uncharacterized protein n=1 Tax=Laccaria amethystina LaAM-08-1 TaxID=1095629 RepID=A0A0C9Y4N8_9AGAR|nr:hypothetical protein K443DRAFT_675374 [Laccaria amethystina LaAM-08-1]
MDCRQFAYSRDTSTHSTSTCSPPSPILFCLGHTRRDMTLEYRRNLNKLETKQRQ